MRTASILLIVSSLSILSGTAFAQNGYGSSQSSDDNTSGYSSSNSSKPGYSSSGSTAPKYSSSGSTTSNYSSSGSTNKPHYSSSGSTKHNNENRKHHRDHDKFSFSLNVGDPLPPPVVRETVFVSPPRPQPVYISTPRPAYPVYQDFRWVGMETGYPLPRDAVVGGGQSMPPATLFVCRAHYRGGLHPGKLLDGRCNISWGGAEIVKNNFAVLTSRAPLRWIPASHGYVPPGAIPGGYQQDGTLYICQADYNGGTHIGKIVGDTCNFGWGGREILIPYYNVLVA